MHLLIDNVDGLATLYDKVVSACFKFTEVCAPCRWSHMSDQHSQRPTCSQIVSLAPEIGPRGLPEIFVRMFEAGVFISCSH